MSLIDRKRIEMMMKRIITKMAFVAIFSILVMSSVEGSEKTYQFTIVNKNNETIIEGSFMGDDSNGDGWIDKTELTNFSEKVYQTCLSGKIQREDWQDFVEEKDYPTILHTLQDVKNFRFGVHEWSQGVTILEFETDTDKLERFAIRGYLFWRKTELKEKGTQVVFFDGVSDGTKGLVFCMSEAEDLRIVVESTDK